MKLTTIPSFTETSSPKLDEVLENIRQTIIIPAYLPKEHKKKIYSQNTKTVEALKTEPVTVDIYGEKIQLKSVNRTKDLRPFRQHLGEIMGMMKERKDFNNIAPILEGFRASGWKLTHDRQLGLMRYLAKRDLHDVVIELARRKATTGFDLSSPELVKVWTYLLVSMALYAFPQARAKATAQSLKWLEMTSILLQSPGQRIPEEALPEIYAGLLLLSATNAAKYLDGKDVEGKVAVYAEKLYATSWKMTLDGASTVHRENIQMKRLLLMLSGSKMALQVLSVDSPLRKTLSTHIPELEGEIKQYKASLEKTGKSYASFRLDEALHFTKLL